MIDKFLSGTGLESCEHVIDEKALPEWDKNIGKIYVCTRCGAKLVKDNRYIPKPGKRVHEKKKERRKRRI